MMMEWEIETLNEREHPFLYYSRVKSGAEEGEETLADGAAAQDFEPVDDAQDLEPVDDAQDLEPVDDAQQDAQESKDLDAAQVQVWKESKDLLGNKNDQWNILDLQERQLKSLLTSITSILLFLVGIYACFMVFTALKRDLLLKNEEMSLELYKEIQDCSSKFKDNYCHLQLPALKDLCLEWKNCMSRPVEIKNLKIILGYVVEVLNWLLELVSLKSFNKMLSESPHVLNVIILTLALLLVFIVSKEMLAWVYRECFKREHVMTLEEKEKIQVLEKVKWEMERRRQRKIIELKSKINTLEQERSRLLAKVKKEKEEEELEKLKILVQKNYEEEQKVLAERALHEKEADLEVMEKLYIDARRQVVLLDVKDALLKHKVNATCNAKEEEIQKKLKLVEKDTRNAAVQVAIKEKKRIKKALPVEPLVQPKVAILDTALVKEKVLQQDSASEEEYGDILVLATTSQRKMLEGKKDLQIQALQKKLLNLSEKHERKESEFNKNMKLYQDTNKVLTELLAKSHDSLKNLEAKNGRDVFVLKSIYESAEAEYLRTIQRLKKENNQLAVKGASRNEHVFEKMNADLKRACSSQENLSIELDKSIEQCQILKLENDSLQDFNIKAEKRLQDHLLEKQDVLARLEKTLDENGLLKDNLEHLLVQIQLSQNTSNNQEKMGMDQMNQMILEHESEIRIWKSKVSELQAYLNSSNQKLKVLEDQLAYSEESPKTFTFINSPTNLSRGSSVETLNNLAEEDINFLCLKEKSLTKAERIQAEDRLSELLIKNFFLNEKK